jgi:phosphate acetyltransferase
VEAAVAGLIEPTLIGDETQIKALAARTGVEISAYPILHTETESKAAELAVAMCRAGNAEALMKGSLHTDELLKPVMARDTGLRTSRRITHVFVMDTPAYARTLLITDAAINISPALEDKVDIVQNAIDLAHALGIPEPKVALLSAIETVNPKIQSTLDAASLCKMADRGQITGGILDGPLAFDTAVSAKAAKIKKLTSPVVGQADILVVPDLESGNMLAKQLEYLGGAQLAGIVLGARVPTILTSRADSAATRLTSCAVAVLLHHAEQRAVKV